MAQREKKGYALKRERGLVPHHYDKASRSYAAGAHKHWPPREPGERPEEYDKRIAKLAMAETPSRLGSPRGHRFIVA